jgi:trans-aconitate methyltransferase
MTSESSWGAFSAQRAAAYLTTEGHPSPESRALLAEILRGLSSGRELAVLDLGCGNGGLYGSLADSGLRLQYTGVDFSEPLLEAARAAFPAATFVRDDVQVVSEVEGPYDVVLYSHVLETLESPQASLQRAGELAPVVVIRFFEPPESDVDTAELREMDVGGKSVPYIRRRMSRDYYRLLLSTAGCESVDVYLPDGSRDQVHVLRFPWPRS